MIPAVAKAERLKSETRKAFFGVDDIGLVRVMTARATGWPPDVIDNLTVAECVAYGQQGDGLEKGDGL